MTEQFQQRDDSKRVSIRNLNNLVGMLNNEYSDTGVIAQEIMHILDDFTIDPVYGTRMQERYNEVQDKEIEYNGKKKTGKEWLLPNWEGLRRDEIAEHVDVYINTIKDL